MATVNFGSGIFFGLNYDRGHLKGEEAYQVPYVRSKPTEKGARMIEQGFSIGVKKEGQWITKTLNRDGIRDIEFLGQYPIGEVTYRDPALPVELKLEAFSPFIPLDLDNSTYPATILNFTINNTSSTPVEAKLDGWLENAVLIQSRRNGGFHGMLVNSLSTLSGNGLRLECSALETKAREEPGKRPDILFEDFESGYGKWAVSGDAFKSDGKPYYHQQPLNGFDGKLLADSFNNGDKPQGKLTSRSFKIERPFMRCLVGGGKHSRQTCVNIMVDDNVVASTTGANSETLQPVTLDLSQYVGTDAVIEIVDAHSGSWGHILVDQIVFSDEAYRELVNKNELTDYGYYVAGAAQWFRHQSFRFRRAERARPGRRDSVGRPLRENAGFGARRGKGMRHLF